MMDCLNHHDSGLWDLHISLVLLTRSDREICISVKQTDSFNNWFLAGIIIWEQYVRINDWLSLCYKPWWSSQFISSFVFCLSNISNIPGRTTSTNSLHNNCNSLAQVDREILHMDRFSSHSESKYIPGHARAGWYEEIMLKRGFLSFNF